jgi:hypothetical protein
MNIYLEKITKLASHKKYCTWYNAIINNALSREKCSGYVEKHHILPRSFKMSGENDSENLVFLNAREHFIVHLLLSKMFDKKNLKSKMVRAAFWMINTRDIKVNNRTYQTLRENFAKISSETAKLNKIGGIKSAYHRERICESNSTRNIWTNEKRKKQREIALKNPLFKPKPHTLESRVKMSKTRLKKFSDKDTAIIHWVNDKFGEIQCTRHELVEKFPELNLKVDQLHRTLLGEHRHRGWYQFGNDPRDDVRWKKNR